MPKKDDKKTNKGIRQGKFIPRNPKKYRGDPSNIIYRSSWEYRVCVKLDLNDNIVEWASEEFFIPYRIPGQERIRRYFPDFWYRTKDDRVVVIEVKPYKETIPPKVSKRKKKETLLAEAATWEKNQAKWAAAEKFCQSKGWTFQKLTEYDLKLKTK